MVTHQAGRDDTPDDAGVTRGDGFYPPSIEALIQKGELGDKLSRDELLLIVGVMEIAVERLSWAVVLPFRKKGTL